MTFPITDHLLPLAEQTKDISQGAVIAVFIIVFLAVSVATAMITYKTRMKRFNKSDPKDKNSKDQ